MTTPEFAFVCAPRVTRRNLEGKPIEVVRATIRYVRGGNALPYLSITGDIFDRHRRPHEERIEFAGYVWRTASSGAVHDDIERAYVELRPFLRWHLANQEGPMHFQANARYYHRTLSEGAPISFETLTRTLQMRRGMRHTLLLGHYPEDPELDTLLEYAADEFESWLVERHPRLCASFAEDLEKLYNLKETLTTWPTPSAKTTRRRSRKTATSTSDSSPR